MAPEAGRKGNADPQADHGRPLRAAMLKPTSHFASLRRIACPRAYPRSRLRHRSGAASRGGRVLMTHQRIIGAWLEPRCSSPANSTLCFVTTYRLYSRVSPLPAAAPERSGVTGRKGAADPPADHRSLVTAPMFKPSQRDTLLCYGVSPVLARIAAPGWRHGAEGCCSRTDGSWALG